MDRQNIVKDLKVVSFDIIYSEVKDILGNEKVFSNGELGDIFNKLQKTINSIDNLLGTLTEKDDYDKVIDKAEVEGEKSSVSEEIPINYNELVNVNEDIYTKDEEDNNTVVESDIEQDEEVYSGEESLKENSSAKLENGSTVETKDKDFDEEKVKSNVDSENYNLEKFVRLTNNRVKAIIVNSTQLRKLRESLERQKQLLDFGPEDVNSKSNEPIASIESLLEQASNLYKEGKIEESEKLYDQIRNMNKDS